MTNPAQPFSDDELLLPSEVAVRVGLTPARIRSLCDSGRLPCQRTPSGRRLIPASAVERLIAERRAARERA